MREKTINRTKFMTVTEAAKLLEVHLYTVRNYFDKGALKGIRHPVNNYRLIERSSVIELARTLHIDEKKLQAAGGKDES